jgi:glycerol-3-phosphate O-acyltransferase/dihydroxyacetone phosphate acyltransferase
MALRSALDRFVGSVCRGLLALFFRRVQVVGAERIPAAGPLVVVGNHVNGLIDPLFVFGPLGIPARMLAKSTLWKIPVLSWLLDLAGAIPVHRRRDAGAGADPAKNLETFARCHEVLRDGGRIALFPEGVSHDEPSLQPLRTGAARIVLEAERRFGPLGVRIAPIGLLFDQRGTFRTRALVVVGEPIDPAPELAAAVADEPAAVRALTERIARAIEALTLNYASWEEARLVELGADVYERMRRQVPREESWQDELVLRRAFAAALPRLRAERPAELAAAVEAVDDYERLLRTAVVTDQQVAERVPFGVALGFALRTLLRLLVALPAALVGTLANILPWYLVHAVASRFRHEPNQVATYQLFPGLILYPATWIALGIAAGLRFGAGWGLAVGFAAPVTGYVALRWHERRRWLWRETRAFLLLRQRRGLAAELHSRRRRVEGAIERLVAYVRGGPESVESPLSRASSRA